MCNDRIWDEAEVGVDDVVNWWGQPFLQNMDCIHLGDCVYLAMFFRCMSDFSHAQVAKAITPWGKVPSRGNLVSWQPTQTFLFAESAIMVQSHLSLDIQLDDKVGVGVIREGGVASTTSLTRLTCEHS